MSRRVEPTAGLSALAPVALDELQSTAALLTRRDRKYLVSEHAVAALIALLPSGSRVLAIDGRRDFQYQSVYFDTPDHRSYLAAARRRPNRFKLRTRTYLDSGRCMLEIKTRYRRGQTRKERLDRGIGDPLTLDPSTRAFARSCDLIGTIAAELEPSLTTSYRRSTILLPGGSRLTIDVGVEAWTPDGRSAALAGMVVIETKSPGPPTLADRALWSMGLRPVRMSKFCTSLAVIDPTLPSNRWTQALRRPWVAHRAPGAAMAG